MKYRFDSIYGSNYCLLVDYTQITMLKFYQNGYYYHFCVRGSERYQEIPEDLELIVRSILDQFVLSPPTPKFINYTKTQKKQVDLLFNILRSL